MLLLLSYSPFLFRVCVLIAFVSLPIRWGNRNSCARRTKAAVLGFCIPSIPCVYRNVVSNFNENSEQTKVDFFSTASSSISSSSKLMTPRM